MERERTTIDDPRSFAGAAGRAPLAAPDPGAPPDVLVARRRSVRALLTAWAVYWLLLLAWVAAPVAWRIWQVRRAAEHGSIKIELGGDGWTLAWIVVPPLLMALVWLLLGTRRKR